MKPRRTIYFTIIALIASFILLPALVSASSNPSAVVQSYNAGSNVLSGMLVGPDPASPTGVVPLSSTNIKALAGVVVPISQAPIALSPQRTPSGQVLVANSGNYQVLVSNQNGSIKAGDYLSVSALDGVAMKTDSSQPEVIGQAEGSFNGQSGTLETVKLKTQSNQSLSVALGRIAVSVRLAPNPKYQQSIDVPKFLSSGANSIANKNVSVAHIYLATAVILAGLVIVGSMLYSAIKSGLIAIGRNPLSKKSILRGLIQTLIISLGVLAIAGAVAYLLLKV